MDNFTQLQFQLIFKLLYEMLRRPEPDLPEGISQEEALRLIEEFAKKVLLSEDLKNFPPPWDREKLLAINLLLLKRFNSDTPTDIPRNLQELVAKYDQYLATQEKVNLAVAMKSSVSYEQVRAALAQIRANLAETNPQLAQTVSILQDTISLNIASNPQQALIALGTYLSDTSVQLNQPLTTEALVTLIQPVADPVISQHLIINNYFETIRQELALHLPSEAAKSAATVATTVKILQPTTPSAELLRLASLHTEAMGIVALPVELPELLAQLDSFDFNATGRALLQQTLVSQGLPMEIAQRLSEPKIADTINFIRGHAPTPQDDTSNTNKVTQRIGVLKELHNLSAHFLENQRSAAFLKYLDRVVSWQKIYQAYEQAYSGYETNFNELYSGMGSNPFLEFALSQGKGYVQDYATGIALEVAVAGPIGAWVMADIKNVMVFDDLLASQAGKSGGSLAAKTVATTAAKATTQATAEAAMAGTAETAAATGAATVPGLGWLVTAAIVAWEAVKKLAKELKPFLQKFSREWAPGIAGGFIFGVVAGVMGLGAIGVAAASVLGGTASMAASAAGGGKVLAMPLSSVATRIFNGITDLAVTQIVLPVVIILGSIPIILALLLFIINSSAYVVPPSSSIGGPFIPGPGGEYPSCWPVEGTITQLTCDDPPDPGDPDKSHCSFFFPPTRNAIDIGADPGTPVYATHDGFASPHRFTIEGYGNHVQIQSRDGSFSTYYAHLRDFAFNEGRHVTAGTLIGHVDDTGNSTGDHLHYGFFSTISIHAILPLGSTDQIQVPTSGCYSRDEGGRNEPIPN